MMRDYTALSLCEKEKLIDFVLSNSAVPEERHMIQEKFESDIFHHGKGIIAKFAADVIQWKASVILKEVGYKNIGFVVEVMVDSQLTTFETCLDELYSHTQRMAETYGLQKMMLGTRNETLMNALAERGCQIRYKVVHMVLQNGQDTDSIPVFTLLPVSHETVQLYVEVYNDAFANVPNGATQTEIDVLAYAEENLKEPKYFFVVNGEDMIGFIQFEINEGVGTFDLGLRKAYHGLGFGNRLLATAERFLKEKTVERIELSTMSSNETALRLYKKYGFVETGTQGNWYDMSELGNGQTAI